ncbi:MAG: F0F1 ATP synthase subunit B [Oscillospiraceae bacterium]
MPEFNDLIYLDWTFIFTIVNTLILFLILKKFLYKPVKKMLEERKKEIDNSYSLAEEKLDNATKMQTEYELRLSTAKQEASTIMKTATSLAQEKSNELVKKAQDKAEIMIENAQKDIEQEKKKAVNQMKNEITDIALMAAEKVAQKELNKQDHQKLIEDFIDNVGDAKWQN